jgi:hypothetical protein
MRLSRSAVLADAQVVHRALPGDTPMIPDPDGESAGKFAIEPVLTWRVGHG